ncbi:trans-resveratrol di-O-methyltransferase-like isoform X2 [Cucumis melo var. makuwa]|uniref:Trans-resveratrol di-O-methyltransferase-like isoform X2 n=1 Tax=Cucumis melo var. makuwa TaxID=1194695 RepID=A0A5D3CDZ7_CUCMM|nr:trans-resveratrol di-O-methyltransferase-like isoform X2 [Cucumis melo var. makuwa]
MFGIMLLKFINSMSLKCVLELGIPDIIHNHGQPMSLSSLVAALHIEPTKAECLSRLMNLLVHSGFFATAQEQDHDKAEDVKYSLTPSYKLLLHHSQATPFLFVSLDKAIIASFQSLSSWFRSSNNNGQNYSNAFEMANGKLLWEYAPQEQTFASLFQQTMVCDSEMIGKIVKQECSEVFEGLKSLVDVGGGTGVMGKAIVEAFPHITCTVFDLPQWILHDWNDEQNIRILKKCKDAIRSREKCGKLIIIDIVMEDKKEEKESTETQLLFDVLMMVNLGGKEMNENEWKNLFMEAGFSGYKIISKLGLRSVIEVYPA